MKADAPSFALGEIVYLRIKPESAGMVTGLLFRPNGHSYAVTWSHDMTERWHYTVELTTEKTFAATHE